MSSLDSFSLLTVQAEIDRVRAVIFTLFIEWEDARVQWAAAPFVTSMYRLSLPCQLFETNCLGSSTQLNGQQTRRQQTPNQGDVMARRTAHRLTAKAPPLTAKASELIQIRDFLKKILQNGRAATLPPK